MEMKIENREKIFSVGEKNRQAHFSSMNIKMMDLNAN